METTIYPNDNVQINIQIESSSIELNNRLTDDVRKVLLEYLTKEVLTRIDKRMLLKGRKSVYMEFSYLTK